MDGYACCMPVIEMNRYTKSACRCTCTHVHQYMSARVYFLENNCENGHAV